MRPQLQGLRFAPNSPPVAHPGLQLLKLSMGNPFMHCQAGCPPARTLTHGFFGSLLSYLLTCFSKCGSLTSSSTSNRLQACQTQTSDLSNQILHSSKTPGDSYARRSWRSPVLSHVIPCLPIPYYTLALLTPKWHHPQDSGADRQESDLFLLIFSSGHFCRIRKVLFTVLNESNIKDFEKSLLSSSYVTIFPN